MIVLDTHIWVNWILGGDAEDSHIMSACSGIIRSFQVLSVMQISPNIPDDEISFRDLWQVLIQRKWWVLGFPLFAVIVAAIAVMFMKPQWEATAVIRVGAVGQAGQAGQAGQQIIEPVAQTVERMKSKAFEDAVLINLSLPTDDQNSEFTFYRGSLQVKNLRGTDLIELKVRGYSQASAKRFADATIDYLKKTHSEMTASTVLRMRQTLERTDRDIAQTKAERDSLVKLTDLKDKDKAGFMENVVLTNNIIRLDEALRSLEQTRANDEEQLDPLHTFPTGHLEAVSVSDKPVMPKKPLLIQLAGVLGLFVGVGVAFLQHVRARKAIRNEIGTVSAPVLKN